MARIGRRGLWDGETGKGLRWEDLKRADVGDWKKELEVIGLYAAFGEVAM